MAPAATNAFANGEPMQPVLRIKGIDYTIEQLFGYAVPAKWDEIANIPMFEQSSLEAAVITGLCVYLKDIDSDVVIVAPGKGNEAGDLMAEYWGVAVRNCPWLDIGYKLRKSVGMVQSNSSFGWGCWTRSYRFGNEEALAGFSGQKLTFVTYGWNDMPEKAKAIILASITSPAHRLINL